jgi:hypothetical protein
MMNRKLSYNACLEKNPFGSSVSNGVPNKPSRLICSTFLALIRSIRFINKDKFPWIYECNFIT